jgi:glycosyltransferase involved in cell wall biosynthesis
MAEVEGISVIICCYNSRERLRPTFEHIAKQEVSPELDWEVILVDNNSNDGTAEHAREIWTDLPCDAPFHIIHEPRAGLSFAREAGISAAQYEYLLFCDDDNWLAGDYVQTAWELMEKDPSVGALGGYGIAECECPPPDWFEEAKGIYATGHPSYPNASYVERGEEMICGAGMALRRQAFEKLKRAGFEFQLTGRKGQQASSGEDIELFFALLIAGYRIFFSPKLTFKHFIPKERLTEDYIYRLHSQGYRNSTIMGAYYHEYRRYPKHLFFYYVWLIKNKVSLTKEAYFLKKKGDFFSINEAKNKLNVVNYLWQSQKEYFESRRKIRRWIVNL